MDSWLFVGWRVYVQLKTTTSHHHHPHHSASHASSSRELQAFFGDETGGALDADDKRKHKPLTKLEQHRDVTNKLQRAKETMKVIEDSKKILARLVLPQSFLASPQTALHAVNFTAAHAVEL